MPSDSFANPTPKNQARAAQGTLQEGASAGVPMGTQKRRAPMEHGTKGNHAALSEFETKIASDVAIWREAEWGDMRVGFETSLSDYDDTELLKGLPGDMCPCPHWGYLLAGRMTVRYADHEDVVKAGDVYYMAPGHAMAAEAGTVLIEFSPKAEFRKLTEIAEKSFARMGKNER